MKGWECPKCGSCYAPTVQRCSECVPKQTGKTGTGKIDGDMFQQMRCMCGSFDAVSWHSCPVHKAKGTG